MKKKIAIIIVCLILVASAIGCCFLFKNDELELKSVHSEAELEKLYKGEDTSARDIATYIFTLPFSIFYNYPLHFSSRVQSFDYDIMEDAVPVTNSSKSGLALDEAVSSPTSPSSGSTETKDYSTTNIQVENVDEADITKTDGDYIYSISELM